MRTLDEINTKIRQKTAVVLTVNEFKQRAADQGVAKAAQQVDVVTTGTFEAMESSGAILNLGHTDPPIKIRQCQLNGVPAYAGFGAVELYIGASQMAEVNPFGESGNQAENRDRGGG